MLPEKFSERMQEMLGAEYTLFLESLNGERKQGLRVNPLKRMAQTEEAVSAEELLAQNFNMTQVSWEKNGYYYAGTDQPGRHPYHEAGLYYIQEPSAMAVAPLMKAKPGERILDLCAAPGGKSTQLAGYLRGEGLLVSNEIHPARAKILSENIERMGVRNACVTNESPARLAEIFVEYFDRILVDAPCSGEGMFRKNETACEEWSPENVELCADRQDEILDHAAQMLRPGGRLVYSTCTFAPQENEGCIGRFLERHEEFCLIPIDKESMGLPQNLCDGRPEWGNREEALRGTLRLWPHVIRGEGHFAAVLQKRGSVPEGYEALSAGGLERGISEKSRDLIPFWEFWRENGSGAFPYLGTFLRFGDNLYLAPKGMPALKGMKVLRPGLHLGAFKKNRFEPSHALALALAPAAVRYVCRLSSRDKEVSAYLNGQTFSRNGEKGWYLITVDGCGIGWGKLAGGIMKNHYPRGLRKNG